MKRLLFWFLIIPFLFGCSTTSKSSSEFSIKFIVDKKWDREQIFNMLQPNDPAGLAVRAGMMGINYDFAKMIHDAKNYSEVRSSLKNFVDNRYREIGDGLEKSINDYSVSWESCIKEFSDVVTEITEHNWFYNSYTCVVSAFHGGISNWYGNTITRRYGVDPIKQRMVTAQEIVLSHVFHISRKYYDRYEAPDHIIWAISEITAILILEDNRLMQLWGDGAVPSSGISGYHQLTELVIKLRRAYKDNSDFLNYLQSAVQLAKEMNRDFSQPMQPVLPDTSLWLIPSIPEDLRQINPAAIGRSIIVDNSISVDLFEAFNYQDSGGWWSWSNKEWTGKGEYYVLFLPMKYAADGSFTWLLNEAQIYVGDDSVPIKLEMETTNITFSLDQFKRLFL